MPSSVTETVTPPPAPLSTESPRPNTADVIVTPSKLRKVLEGRSSRTLTDLIFSIIEEFPEVLPFVALNTGVSQVNHPSHLQTTKYLPRDCASYTTSSYPPLARPCDPTSKRVRALSPSPVPSPPPKRRKRSAAKARAHSPSPFSLHGVYNITCPYLASEWPDSCAGSPLTLRLAPSSTGRHLWGSFRFGIVEGTLRSTSSPPFASATTISFAWRGRETGEDSVLGDTSDGTEGEITLGEDGSVRGRLEGAFLDEGRCLFEGHKVHDKRYRASDDKFVRGWKKEWRALPSEMAGQPDMIIFSSDEVGVRPESPLSLDTSADEEDTWKTTQDEGKVQGVKKNGTKDSEASSSNP
ncbi:hypothetical protein BD626DRAFT_478292 [Schizophyllum amplum]|uniref:Uncharacterized protein n=1 Tax=Schizophyllum amplum TaxID=97359 RepID=A0A550CRD0_9AGAR|nr:hypothetical protein BD626DRAFT_478292 [Auriculariopsis ampla]